MRVLVLYSTPAVFIILGLPLWLRLVPPNRLYGYRTAMSFASDAAWYTFNEWIGAALVIAGAAALGANLLIERLLAAGWNPGATLLVCVLVDVAVVTLVAAVLVLRIAR